MNNINNSVSIIIPAFNEDKRIEQTIRIIHEYFKAFGIFHEIIVVDDGSKDRTLEIANALRREIPQIVSISMQRNSGKGASTAAGMKHASMPLRLLCDADLSTPISEYFKLVRWIDLGYDIAIGSRVINGAKIVHSQPPVRVIIGSIFGWLSRRVIGDGIFDIQCGFKLFTKKATDIIFTQTKINRFAFDVEVMIIARINDLKIKESPIEWSHNKGSKVRIIRDGINMAFDLMKIKRYLKKNCYNKQEY